MMFMNCPKCGTIMANSYEGEPCEHIYGVEQGFDNLRKREFCLLMEKQSDNYDSQELFTFCPKCGEKLIDE